MNEIGSHIDHVARIPQAQARRSTRTGVHSSWIYSLAIGAGTQRRHGNGEEGAIARKRDVTMITSDAQEIIEGTSYQRYSNIERKPKEPAMPTQTASQPKVSSNDHETATIQKPKSEHARCVTRFGGEIIKDWGDNIFLVLEKNRNGLLQYHVRMIFGEMESYRFGPWSSEEVARELFDKAVRYFEREMVDVFCGAADVSVGSRDAGNYEEIGNFSIEY